LSLLITTLQLGEVPEHAPLQPRKLKACGRRGVSVTVLPWTNLVEHVFSTIDPGEIARHCALLLRPIDKVKRRLNVAAVTNCSFTISVHVGWVPAQAPLSP